MDRILKGEKPSSGGEKPSSGGGKPSSGGEKPSSGGGKSSSGGGKLSSGGAAKKDRERSSDRRKRVGQSYAAFARQRCQCWEDGIVHVHWG